MLKKDLLRSLWGERAYRGCGKSTRLTLLSMVMYTIMKGHVLSTRYVCDLVRIAISLLVSLLSFCKNINQELFPLNEVAPFLLFWLQSICMSSGKSHYTGPLNGTIHVVVGGGGAHLSDFTTLQTSWSLYKDYDFGFVKLTAFNHSSLLFEYKKSRDGKVYDSFTINRDYRDILTCTVDSCPRTTMAS